jgi:hypothetical protein
MRNAKEEFLNLIKDKELKCAIIEYQKNYGNTDVKATLKVGFSEEDLENFLKKINVKYDAGYGGQELFGTVWFQDGNWADRGEYDGSEWWEYKKCPEILKELL